MKKIFLSLLLCTVMATGLSAQKYSLKSLVGKWEAVDGAGIEVIDSTKIFLTYHGERKQISSYQADFSKTPCWFDFIIRDGATTITLKSLLLFVSDDLLQWQVFEDIRPDNFDASVGNIMNLKRKR